MNPTLFANLSKRDANCPCLWYHSLILLRVKISLIYISIRVEPYKNSGPAQCHACQNFGHSSAHCNHSARCVKCGENHPTKDCVKTAELLKLPKCCNCGGDHTANYRRFPFYAQQTAMHQQTRSPPTTSHHPTSSGPNPSTPQVVQTSTSNTSFAAAAKQSLNSSQKMSLINLVSDTIMKISTSEDIKATITHPCFNHQNYPKCLSQQK